LEEAEKPLYNYEYQMPQTSYNANAGESSHYGSSASSLLPSASSDSGDIVNALVQLHQNPQNYANQAPVHQTAPLYSSQYMPHVPALKNLNATISAPKRDVESLGKYVSTRYVVSGAEMLGFPVHSENKTIVSSLSCVNEFS
jgi:hypothetical protein